jgi:hypothetical protein
MSSSRTTILPQHHPSRLAADHRTLSLLILALSGTLLPVPAEAQMAATRGGNVQVAAILEQLRLSLNRTRSIRYKGEYRWESPVRREGSKQVHYIFEYIADGNLFYSSFDSQLAEIKGSRVLAYDGKDYQELLDGKLLERSRTLQTRGGSKAFSGLLQPIVMQFAFAYARPPYDFNILLNKSTWDSIAAIASLKGEEPHAGRPCTVLTFDRVRHRRQVHYSIYLDKALDYYPVKVVQSSPGAGRQFESVVTILKVATAQGDVFVPVRIASTATISSGSQKGVTEIEECTIEPDSLRVNVAVDRSAFTIQPDRSAGLYDLDTRTWVRRPSDGVEASYNAMPIIVAGVGIILLVAVIIAYKKLVTKAARSA